MNEYIRIKVIDLIGLAIFVLGLTFALGAYVGTFVFEKEDTDTTVLSAGHLQCKLDNIKSSNEWKAELIESTKREASTLVKMHIAKTALANLTGIK